MEKSEQEQREIVRQEDLVPSFAISLEEAKKRIDQLQQFISSQLKEDEDYGIIPGTKKPSLYKPGAEKLAILYGLSPRFTITDSNKDWQNGFFHYQLKCELISKRTGFISAEGVGSCNSKESKYRNSDAYTLDNTILKMAKKRALVDAVLTATRTSGIFTQDVEDITDKGILKAADDMETETTDDNKTDIEMASESQAKAVYAICKSRKMSDEDIKALMQDEYGISNTHDLTKKQASALIDKLQKSK